MSSEKPSNPPKVIELGPGEGEDKREGGEGQCTPIEYVIEYGKGFPLGDVLAWDDMINRVRREVDNIGEGRVGAEGGLAKMPAVIPTGGVIMVADEGGEEGGLEGEMLMVAQELAVRSDKEAERLKREIQAGAWLTSVEPLDREDAKPAGGRLEEFSFETPNDERLREMTAQEQKALERFFLGAETEGVRGKEGDEERVRNLEKEWFLDEE